MSERGQSDGNPGEQRDDALRAAVLRLSRRQGARDAAALRELTDPYPLRLSDRQRAAIERLSSQLIRDIEDELRGIILADGQRPENDGFEASLGAAHVAIATPILEKAGLLPDPGVVALALERSDMHEAGRRLRDSGAADDRLAALVGEGADPASGAAMALLIAESRANLRFDDPQLPLNDVPGRLGEALIWRVAAALRQYGVAQYGITADEMDRSASAAAQKLCADISEETGLFAAAVNLAEALVPIDAGLLREALETGRLALYCAMLGAASDIEPRAGWALASDTQGIGHALLLCAAGIDRNDGAGLVMTLLGALGQDIAHGDDEPSWLAVWDIYDQTAAAGALDHWRRPAPYREALGVIGQAGRDGGA